MTLKIILYNETGRVVTEVQAKSFRLRSNNFNNWIQVKLDNGETIDLYGVYVVEGEE